MFQRRVTLLVIFMLVAAAVLTIARGDEDNWLCVDGQWVKHGSPSAAAPSSGCGAKVKGLILDERVKVDEPAVNAEVTSPLTIKGQARGTWFFEASFPVKLFSADGEVLAAGVATAQGEWMTDEFVPFTAILEFNAAAGTKGNLVLQRDNPSGLPANDAQVVVPVRLK